MLHHVEFLCSVVAAFARFVHAVRKAFVALMCSPKHPSPAPAPGHASLPPLLPLSWKRLHGEAPVSAMQKVHPAGDAGDEAPLGKNSELSSNLSCKRLQGDAPAWATQKGVRDGESYKAQPAVDFAGGEASPEKSKECNVADRTEKKPAVGVARKRPSRLVIPACCGVGTELGDAMARETEVVEKEVEVEGEGFWLASRRGCRHVMEDGYGVITDKISGDSHLAFYGVYDGHGGRAAVDFVSERLGKNIVASLNSTAAKETQEEMEKGDRLEMAVRTGYLTTDREFLSQGVRGGACAATALVKDGELYVANVGDCRVVMSTDGAASALTTDQSAGREDERIRIESSGGYVSCNNGMWRVQDSLAVSRAFGNMDMKEWVISEPEIKKVHLTRDCDFLVIASDGLWVKVSNQEAVDVVSRHAKSMDSCKQLVNIARSRGSRDDITVMVVDLQRFVQ